MGNSDKMYITKGLLQKQQMEIDQQRDRQNGLAAKMMKGNIVIIGIKKSPGDNAVGKALNFFKDTMSIQVERNEIVSAYRFGSQIPDNPRQLSVQCQDALIDRIFNNVKNLHGKKNDQGKYYSVYRQLPDAWSEEKRELELKLKR